MHSMGFWHEHTRPDRDKYIEIIEENILEESEYNLFIPNINQANLVGEYDLCSIMHYFLHAFTKYPGKDTMKPKRKKCSECYGDDCKNCYNCDIGSMKKNDDMDNLTDMDIEKMNVYYNCKEIGT